MLCVYLGHPDAYRYEALSFTPQMGTAYLSAFYMGYAIMVLPGGILADRIGYRYTILVSLLAMAVITALMSTIDNYTYGWVFTIRY